MASWKALRGESSVGANDGEDEAQFRQLWSYFYEQDSTGKAKTGVVAGYTLSATTPSASGSVVVGIGLANCQPTTNGGAFPLPNTTGNLDIFTANPMQFESNPRNDIVIVDSTDGQVKALIGTPNATPSLGEQSVPATAVGLWRIRHAAGATTIPGDNFDDLRTFVGPWKSQNKAPFADYSRGAGGAITRATWTKLAYTTQNHLEGGITYSGGDFTVPTAGLYECRGQVMFSGSAGLVTVGSLIAVDGATQETSYAQAMASGNWSARASRTLRLTAGQKVSFSAYHDATANIATQADLSSTWCSVRRVGD